jgi:hypothetical protein
MSIGVKWVEFWFDSSTEGEGVLVLRELADGTFQIWDPQKQSVDSEHDTYEAARESLVDDEYVLVEGRESIGSEPSDGTVVAAAQSQENKPSA